MNKTVIDMIDHEIQDTMQEITATECVYTMNIIFLIHYVLSILYILCTC